MNTLWGDTTKPFSIFCLPFQWWSTLRKKRICSYWRKILSFLCVDTIFRRASTSWEDTGIHQKCSPLWKWKQHLEAYPFILSEIISESSPKNNSSSKVHNITVWQLTQLFQNFWSHGSTAHMTVMWQTMTSHSFQLQLQANALHVYTFWTGRGMS